MLTKDQKEEREQRRADLRLLRRALDEPNLSAKARFYAEKWWRKMHTHGSAPGCIITDKRWLVTTLDTVQRHIVEHNIKRARTGKAVHLVETGNPGSR